MLQADISYQTIDSTYSLQAQVSVDTFVYAHQPLGDFSLSASYLPENKTDHLMDVRLLYNRKMVLSSLLHYYSQEEDDSLSGKLSFYDLPLWHANLFIPNDDIWLRGALNGNLEVYGMVNKPLVNGALSFDTTKVEIAMAGANFSLDTLPILVKDNILNFRDYPIYASGRSPFLIDGTIDLERQLADLKLTADNYPLLNAKKTARSLVYGKAYIAVNTSVKGPLSALRMRGDVRLLGTTDLTYILKESPLSVQDRMAGIVQFTSFVDTVEVVEDQLPLKNYSGVDIAMSVHVDPSVRVKVDLSETDDNHVVLEGGGDLSLQLTPSSELFLSGRYTLSGGNLKYSLPIIPLKNFKIKPDSYVEWTGNWKDPYLSLTATENIRTSVVPEEKVLEASIL